MNYLTIINNHLPGIEDRRLNEVTNSMVQEYLQKMAENQITGEVLGEKSLLNIKNFLSLIFNQAIKNGILLRNPITGVKVPKAGTKVTRVLTLYEQNMLLNAACEYPKPILFAVVFALYTRCRKGEVIGLQWKDVDFEENVIHISHQLSRHYDIDETGDTKTKFSVRDIYMFKSFADEFKAYKKKMIEWKSKTVSHTRKRILCLLAQRIKQLNQECSISITKRSWRTPESKIVISTHSRKRRRHLDGIAYTRSFQHFNDAQ